MSLVQMWYRDGLHYGSDVTTATDDRIVVCDVEDKNINLYSSSGDLLTSTSSMGIEFVGYPWGVTHDPVESAIIVTDHTGAVTFLSDTDLSLDRTVDLEDIKDLGGIGVLPDGKIVVGGVKNPKGIFIHDRDGKRIKDICGYEYMDQDNKVTWPWYVTVAQGDTIVASMWQNSHVAFLTPSGDCLNNVDIPWPGGLAIDTHNDVIVVSQAQNKLYKIISKDGINRKQLLLELSDTEVEEYGNMVSVSQAGQGVAVLFEKGIGMYKM